MTGVPRVLLPALLALALAGCGTIPPPASPPAPAATAPGPSLTSDPSASSTTSSPTARPSVSATSSPTPRPTRPTKAAPTPPPDTWVGHFKGHEVWVPRGHGAAVSFTFDDGPWPGSTSQVLGLLAQHHVHAVFCLIGDQAKTYPSLVKKEVAGGHELCDHSRDHDLTMNKKGRKYVDAEVADGLADVRAAAPHGTPVTFYRQPGGLWDPTVVKAMDAHGLDPLRWSDDPRDWSRPGSAVIVHRVVSHLHPGVVILMHDGGGDRSQSVEALRFLLDAVVAAGWHPVLAPHVKLSAKAAARPQ
ncbi:polysaccharide deacetylase family protein [Microlunatus antarcticus]|uniref:Peptidoglycan/xylan/chitin deacetylase (PgdA/CDA1 family) n=1 Tax=Microlunatus antarcticus TaxID=53388 RepID=A0A7W5JX66_9ACTN|nr:peptidoglycan/xylan/chitin deacetylase (PgdA/CDA1 family) [Microlunatus antarcticus]